MATTIIVISDTHCLTWGEVHPKIRKAVGEADIVVHCGDYTRMTIVNGVKRAAKKMVLVHGNSDPPELRQAIPATEIFEVEGKRIGVTHPVWGTIDVEMDELLEEFASDDRKSGPPVDAIIFGHTHEPLNEKRDGVLFVNPGQGYASFMVPATIAVLTVDSKGITAEIRTIEEAR